MTVDLASAVAGDREMTDAERHVVRQQVEIRGIAFFSDLLKAVTHHSFAPESASVIWASIMSHKRHLAGRLGRDVGITVAACDYLSNVAGGVEAVTLISESDLAEIESRAMRDGMTGLFNHSSFYELLERELGSHRRYGGGVAVLVLDVDALKLVNDGNGHREGDRILVAVADTLRDEARDSDICCRLGGDEFAVILRSTDDPVEAREVAERIRARVASIHCDGFRVAVSVGVAMGDHLTSSPGALVERADQALYEAKRGGRDRVMVAAASRPGVAAWPHGACSEVSERSGQGPSHE